MNLVNTKPLLDKNEYTALSNRMTGELSRVVQALSTEIVMKVESWLEKTCTEEDVAKEECELHVHQSAGLDNYVLKKDGKLIGIPLTINYVSADLVGKEITINEVQVKKSGSVDDALPVKKVGVRTERTIQRPTITWGKKKRG